MKKKIFIFAILILLIAVLQSTLMGSITIFGAKANLFVLFVIAVGIIKGSQEAAIMGVIIGVLNDSISPTVPFGVYILLFMYLGVVSGVTYKAMIRANFIVMMAAAFIGTLLYTSADFIFTMSGAYWQNGIGAVIVGLGSVLIHKGIWDAVYNIVISIPIYWIVQKIYGRLDLSEGNVRGKYKWQR